MTEELPWIDPVGGLGDMLMVSGVLKLVFDRTPRRRFNLVRRSGYLDILDGHPALAEVGHPPAGAAIASVSYWAMEKPGPGEQRAFQVLARSFGLATPVPEQLYVPSLPASDPILERIIPTGRPTILLGAMSDSPRKTPGRELWSRVVELLRGEGATVLRAGRLDEPHVRGTFSLLGLTTPKQLIALLPRCDLVITADSFFMHAAHLAGVPAVVVWGPTDHRAYGYPEQIHLLSPRACGRTAGDVCFESQQNDELYATPCPLGDRHCVDQIRPEAIAEAARQALLSANGSG